MSGGGRAVGMRVFSVDIPGAPYPVHIGPDLLVRVGGLVRELVSPLGDLSPRCAIVTNPVVRDLYAPQVVVSLSAAGFEPHVLTVPDGEAFKTVETVSRIYDGLIDAQLDRRSIVFALGGGVVGDMAGFAAATLLRGVQFVPLPTTLLATVDASIGGKTAVDHPRGKNLLGAFKQPLAIVADTTTLHTLPAAEWRSGMAEVVKHAIIADPGLFEQLELSEYKTTMEAWLPRAMRVKVDIVGRDPFERNERAKLNLGHTFGHAFERVSGYSLRHGDAVAAGIVCAARLAARRGMCAPALVARIKQLLARLDMPFNLPTGMPAGAVLDAMQTDKKRVAGRLQFILPRALGDVVAVDDVSVDEVRTVLGCGA